MNRSCAPHIVRAILGQDCLIHNTPSTSFPCNSSPETGSTIAGSIPKNGNDALPGLVGVPKAIGVMT
jgi:hypothetical protein